MSAFLQPDHEMMINEHDFNALQKKRSSAFQPLSYHIQGHQRRIFMYTQTHYFSQDILMEINIDCTPRNIKKNPKRSETSQLRHDPFAHTHTHTPNAQMKIICVWRRRQPTDRHENKESTVKWIVRKNFIDKHVLSIPINLSGWVYPLLHEQT